MNSTDLGWIQIEQRCPGNGIESLEKEHDSHIAVDETARGSARIVGVQFGESPDDEQAGDEQRLRDERRRLSPPYGATKRAHETTCKRPNVENDICLQLICAIGDSCGVQFSSEIV